MGGLGEATTKKDLHEYFSSFGTVVEEAAFPNRLYVGGLLDGATDNEMKEYFWLLGTG